MESISYVRVRPSRRLKHQAGPQSQLSGVTSCDTVRRSDYLTTHRRGRESLLPIEATKAKGRGDESRQRLIYFHIFIPNKYIHTNEHSIHLEKTNDRHQRPHAHRLLLLARSALKNDVRAASLSASIAVVLYTRRFMSIYSAECHASLTWGGSVQRLPRYGTRLLLSQ